MLVVLSDLHFAEAQSSQIGDLRFNRNLAPDVYQTYFSEVNQIAVKNKVDKIDLILAGDILEISRSGLWLESDERPYVSNEVVSPSSKTERTILNIIKAIACEERVQDTLEIFRHIQDHFKMQIDVHYLLGNHDRLVNATPDIRRQVRTLLGLPGEDSRFLYQFILRDHLGQPFCLVRHGHEYDPMNFSVNIQELETLPAEFSQDSYGEPCLGDIITIEYGAALPYYLVEEYGENSVISDSKLTSLYHRLMAFDDVRPSTALLSYLFSTPGLKKRQTWELMEPCFLRVFQALSENQLIEEYIDDTENLNFAQRALLNGLLDTKLFTQNIPYWTIKETMKQISKTLKLKSPVKYARREALIQNADSGCKCVISGHTHFPEVSLISATGGDQRYYINTGTWRNVIPATRSFKGFGRLNAMSKVMVYAPDELSGKMEQSSWSFDFLSGVSFGQHRN